MMTLLGRLYKNDDGRFEHIREVIDGEMYRDYWTSGDGIEVRVAGRWTPGRMEFSEVLKGYYFIPTNAPRDTISALAGMLARRPEKARWS